MSQPLDIARAEELLDLPDVYFLQDVHRCYRIKCKLMHPDARQGVSADVANAEMSQITSAYSLLRKQFRGDAKEISITRRKRKNNAGSYSPQNNESFYTPHYTRNDDFDPFGNYDEFVNVDELFDWEPGSAEMPSYSDNSAPNKAGIHKNRADTWNDEIRRSQYHYSHTDPHTIDRSREAHIPYTEPEEMLISSCDGPGWWRDQAWFLPEDPSWYRDAMRMAHWLPWALIVYIVALLSYPLPILSAYGEMTIVGDIGQPIWFHSVFLMVYPFIGWFARHPIHDLCERIFAFPFRVAYRIFMRIKRKTNMTSRR